MLEEKCKVENCENNVLYKKSILGDYCCRHYNQIRLYNKILERTIFDPNEIIDCGDYYEICLYNNKNEEVGRAKIDKEDLEKIKQYKWCINSQGYVITRINKKIILSLHIFIFGNTPVGYEVDHHDTNRLNNRKSNLRLATKSQNAMNKKVKGYYWNKEKNKWHARIWINGKKINLGYFTDEQDAIKARKEAEIKYFGEFVYKETNE